MLDVADLDSRIDQLRHQLASLPETVEINALAADRGTLDDQARDARILVDDLTGEQSKADADVEQVKARRLRDQSRIDAGQITNPKDLERMQHELVSLERRIASLEDTELEVMEKLEEAQKTLDAVTFQLRATDERLVTLTAARDERATEVDGELRSVMTRRAEAVNGMPEDLMALYERIRGQSIVGAAPLRARQCGGCQMAINASELSVIAKAAADEVIRCEECSRILVRTTESGL
ncbi:zinc ribbon domain-containing protein [Nocardioides sp.]|uniref:zinc ribbon domain-containing protein n=1 Tax=Nocardioides sp. TaxID=35761 RepID=UPI003D0A4F3C